MKKKILPYTAALCAAAVLLAAAAWAAYIGTGRERGVLVATDYYFSSNVLRLVSSATPTVLAQNQVICNSSSAETASKPVYISNSNTKGNFNNFDVTYKISFWIDADDANYQDGIYSYTVLCGGDTKTVTTSAQDALFSDCTITGNSINNDIYTVNWTVNEGKTADISKACKIYVLAEPTYPLYMASRNLGGVLVLGSGVQIESSSCTAAFIPELTGDLKGFAAFDYRIKVSGTPDSAHDTITVSWRADKLALDTRCEFYSSVTSSTDTDGNQINSFTVNLSSNTVYDIVFFRGSGWNYKDITTDGEITAVSDETLSTLNSYINYTFS